MDRRPRASLPSPHAHVMASCLRQGNAREEEDDERQPAYHGRQTLDVSPEDAMALTAGEIVSPAWRAHERYRF